MVNDKVPSKAEIRAAVKRLRNNRASGASAICAKDINRWLQGAEEEDKGSPARTEDKWRVFVYLIQLIFEHGEIPVQMQWVMIVLLPKGDGDYRGIGLINPIHKTV